MVFALYALFVAGWTALRFTPLASFRPFELADLFAWVMYLPLPVFILAAAVRLRLRALVWMLLPLAAFSADYGPLFLPQRQPAAERRLKVMTTNLLFVNADADAVAAEIRSVDPDVVALHELSASMARGLSDRLRSRYPYRVLYPHGDALGMGVMSKIAMTEVSKPSLGRDKCSCHVVSLTLKGAPIRIINAHPLPPGHTPETFNPDSQAATIRALKALAESQNQPFLMVGDFNTGDRHRFYRELRSVVGDSFRDAGTGFGFTWPASRPLVRIDYILHSPKWSTVSASTGSMKGSDHRWVAAVVALP